MKRLGVNIDHKLTWKNYIDYIHRNIGWPAAKPSANPT